MIKSRCVAFAAAVIIIAAVPSWQAWGAATSRGTSGSRSAPPPPPTSAAPARGARSAAPGAAAGGASPATLPARIAGQDVPTSLLTLHYTNAPARDVLADIVRQLGLPAATFDNQVDGLPAVTIDVINQPYWSILPALMDQVQRTVTIRGDGAVTVSANKGMMLYGARYVSGPFLVVLATLSHSVALPGAPGQIETASMQCYVYPEPTLNMRALVANIAPEIARDERGNSLVPKDKPAFSRISADNLSGSPVTAPMPFFLRLQPPLNVGTQLTQLQGRVSVWISKDPQKATVSAIFSSPATCMLGQYSLTVRPPRKTADRAFQVQVEAPARSDAAMLMTAMTLDVFDSAGKPLFLKSSRRETPPFLFDVTQVDPAGKNDTDAPAKIVITMPTVLQEIVVPFDYKNVAFP